jgi:hypothetical protein
LSKSKFNDEGNKFMKIKDMKSKFDNLEKQMLAISSVNDMCQRALYSNSNEIGNLQSCAELLNHLIEPAMFQIEELRNVINEMNEGLKLVASDGWVICS